MSTSTLSLRARLYWFLTKPGIIFGNILTTIAGFVLAAKGTFNPSLCIATLLGLSLVMASACVFNNYIDCDLDKKMKRTKNRSLVTGDISKKSALTFGTSLGLLGAGCLFIFTNPLATLIALVGLVVYVFLYSFAKYKTVHFTLIGSVAGAIPPVVGYCAVSNALDLCALLLFAILVLWQMPHFFAIAIYRLEDYAAGSIPVLPNKKGIFHTKVQMLFYTIAFVGISLVPFILGYVGDVYLMTACILGSTWLWICVKGFTCSNDHRWARQVFSFPS
ncbi:MAG: heme o synthase [Rhabdochlamydiaceae bacterium]|jgi:protoheme IX farnesyltransferase